MSIASKILPIESRDDVIGGQKFMKDLTGHINDKNPVIVWGPPGIGKSSISRMLLKDAGYHIREYNASEQRDQKIMRDIYFGVRSLGLIPVAFLLDEVDGLDKYSFLEKIVDVSIVPLVMTCNRKDKIPEEIRKKCQMMRLWRPRKQSVLKRVKQIAHDKGIKIDDYSVISNDVRSSLQAITGTMGYTELDHFSVVHEIMMGNSESIEEFILDNMSPWFLGIWLYHNVTIFSSGRKFYNNLKIIGTFGRTGRVEVLRLIRPDKDGRVEFPDYFKLRKKKKKSGRKKEKKNK